MHPDGGGVVVQDARARDFCLFRGGNTRFEHLDEDLVRAWCAVDAYLQDDGGLADEPAIASGISGRAKIRSAVLLEPLEHNIERLGDAEIRRRHW